MSLQGEVRKKSSSFSFDIISAMIILVESGILPCYR